MSVIRSLWARIKSQLAARGQQEILYPPVPPEAIAAREAELGVQFPAELRESLLECGGTKPDTLPLDRLLSLEELTVQGSPSSEEVSLVLASGWGALPAGAGQVIDVMSGDDGSYRNAGVKPLPLGMLRPGRV